jgi:hypothetical protein
VQPGGFSTPASRETRSFPNNAQMLVGGGSCGRRATVAEIGLPHPLPVAFAVGSFKPEWNSKV